MLAVASTFTAIYVGSIWFGLGACTLIYFAYLNTQKFLLPVDYVITMDCDGIGWGARDCKRTWQQFRRNEIDCVCYSYSDMNCWLIMNRSRTVSFAPPFCMTTSLLESILVAIREEWPELKIKGDALIMAR